MERALLNALAKLLKPLIRILLRDGVAFADFAEIAKKVYVDVAEEDFAVAGRKQTVSRVSVLTGIHRREVARLLAIENADDGLIRQQHNRAARVINGWRSDSDFSSEGQPLALGFPEEFSRLVKRYSGDIPSRAVYDELTRVGAVSQSQDGKVCLLVEAYVPRESKEDMLYLLGECVTDLLNTVDHNIEQSPEQSRLQMNVTYDNIPDAALEEIRMISTERSMEFLKDFNRFLSSQDRNSELPVQGSGRNRVGVGLYYFEEPGEDENEQ